LIVGFIGVIVLFSDKLSSGNLSEGFAGQLAIVGASFCYGLFTSWGRKLIQDKIEPVVVAFATMVVAAVATAPFALFAEGGFSPLLRPIPSNVLFAVILLGLLNTFIAYLFYYSIVRELGASRATMVTYVVPAVGLILGWLILKESVGISLLIGGTLIIIGIGIVNLRPAQLYRQLRLKMASQNV
ncbi:MAG: DMT family transporter, partial [Anaerolineae bacterium]|nr:DMT family transporter [Anaerolineae bacterium]